MGQRGNAKRYYNSFELKENENRTYQTMRGAVSVVLRRKFGTPNAHVMGEDLKPKM